MAVYAQHGYGKSHKLQEGLKAGYIQGVIFSPRDEKPENLAACITQLREEANSARLMVDPQFHLSVYVPAKDRYLPDYPHYKTGRRRRDFVGSRRLREYASSTIDFQRELDVDILVAATVHVDAFDEREHEIALNLASESMDYHSALANEHRPLLLSWVVAEHALTDRNRVDEFLDEITAWDAYGVYLVVARADAGYSQRIDSNRLAQLTYAVHVLGDLNGFEVVCGYADIHGVLLRGAGAAAFATGWSQSCRQYHRSAFLQRERGGRRPRLRYCSTPLLNSVFLGELEQGYDVGKLERVLSGTDLDGIITSATSPESSAWDQRASELQHWEALTALDQAIEDDVAKNVERLGDHIASAQALYAELEAAGVAFERATHGVHLEEWAEAVHTFKDRAGF